MNMNETTIVIGTFENAKRFASIASNIVEDLDIVSGRYVIDAKSIMGLLSLDISCPVKLIIHSNDESVIDEIIRKFDDFDFFKVMYGNQ